MDFGGRYLFEASRQEVWVALNDTEKLKAAIPGCDRIVWTTESTLEAAISVDLGIAKPRFVGDLVLTDVQPAISYTLSGRGRGGLLGHVGAAASITLSDHDRGCVLDFGATGKASGALMKLGRSLLGSSAQGVIDRFFVRFAGAMDTKIFPIDRQSGEGGDLPVTSR